MSPLIFTDMSCCSDFAYPGSQSDCLSLDSYSDGIFSPAGHDILPFSPAGTPDSSKDDTCDWRSLTLEAMSDDGSQPRENAFVHTRTFDPQENCIGTTGTHPFQATHDMPAYPVIMNDSMQRHWSLTSSEAYQGNTIQDWNQLSPDMSPGFACATGTEHPAFADGVPFDTQNIGKFSAGSNYWDEMDGIPSIGPIVARNEFAVVMNTLDLNVTPSVVEPGSISLARAELSPWNTTSSPGLAQTMDYTSGFGTGATSLPTGEHMPGITRPPSSGQDYCPDTSFHAIAIASNVLDTRQDSFHGQALDWIPNPLNSTRINGWPAIAARPVPQPEVEVSQQIDRLGNPLTREGSPHPMEGQGVRTHGWYHEVTKIDGLYHCPVPGCQHKPTKLKCNYDKYIDTHVKPFRCKDSRCGDMRFSSMACQLRHEREAHGLHGHGDRPYACIYEDCERSNPQRGFPRRYNLLDHMRRVHKHVVEADDDATASPVTSRGDRVRRRKLERTGQSAPRSVTKASVESTFKSRSEARQDVAEARMLEHAEKTRSTLT